MTVFVGIDGGGTKTRALVATPEGDVLADLTVDGCNVNRFGWEKAQEVLADLFQKIRNVLPDGKRVSALYLGMAGVDREADRRRMNEWVRAQWASEEAGADAGVKTLVEHDALPALVAGTGVKEGIVLIAGTGSIAFGIDAAGKEARVGGWGYLIGDEGSGYDIGRKTMQAVMKSSDGRLPETKLTQLLLERFGVEQASGLIPVAYADSFSKEQMAEVTRFVFQAAGEGDRVAIGLLEGAAGELSELVQVLLGKLQFAQRPVPVVVTGGLFHEGSPLREMVQRNLQEQAVLLAAERPPVVGALILAQKL